MSSRPIGKPVALKVPLGLPPVPVPADDPPTVEAIALGRTLFYDTRLSKNDRLSCSSCHNPLRSFTDGLATSRGVSGITGKRNAPTLLNAAYLPLLFWDGRAASLEAQAATPIADPLEMNQTHDVSVSKLRRNAAYKQMFKQTFGTDDVTIERVESALASFERTLLSGDSAFDQYRYGGDSHALNFAQIRGLSVFTDPGRGNCETCHTIQAKYALFTDDKFHNTGEGVNDDEALGDDGRFRETGVEADHGAFRTPDLRNVALTGPYMHDGKLKSLKDVVDFYAGHGNSNPYLDKEISRIHLTGEDRADLVQFLQSLNGDMPANAGPPEKVPAK